MAREFVESLFYYEMDRASASNSQNGPTSACSEEGNDMFFFIKRNIAGMFSNFGLPFTRSKTNSGSSNKRPESITEGHDNHAPLTPVFADNIEMAHFGHVELLVRGHDFVLQQLTNPTWCDECGDFIWGLIKQCLRCKYCSFTCHQKCAQLVRLSCKSSPEETPEDPEETSLSEASDTSHNASNDCVTEASNEKDETDSGYRSGTIPDEKLPRQPSQATLNREELKTKLEDYNQLVPGANLQLTAEKDDDSFQGFIKVTLNLVRPICMSLGARPPSIYEVLTKEHIVEQNTQTISFYMPRDTVKSIHVGSDVTVKEVISLLLKKFHILDNPRKFALYEQELSAKGKIVRLRRIPETDCPLPVSLQWESEKIDSIRFVLQENESGEVNWEAFSLPELNNFLRVLDREEAEYTSQLEYKYKVMKRIVNQRLKELRKEKRNSMLTQSSTDGNRNSTAES